MKKILIIIISISLVIGISYYFYHNKDKINASFNSLNKESPQNDKKEDEIKQKAKDTLSTLSLEEKIAQMIIIDIRKENLTEEDYNFLKDFKPGGFILFKENFSTYENSLAQIKQIKETSKIPMFISIDEEGGRVERISDLSDVNVTKIPNMYDVGLTQDATLAYEVSKIIAQKIKVFGINMDFAPVADIFSNPNNTVIGQRSYGNNKEIVSLMAINGAKGLQDEGIIPVYKHFPGHGDTDTDSHFALPIINKNKDELYDLELAPFQKAIENGAKMIMVGHLAVPQITGDTTPASLSKKIITNLLKEEMGYQNLVITDSLKMKGITNYYTETEIYELAINAGVDILLMPENPQNAVRIIKEAINLGKIEEKQIDASVQKILKLKYQMIEENYNTYLPKEYLNSPLYDNILQKIG